MEYQAPIGAADPDDPYIDGNPATGTSGSPVPAKSIEHPMREIVNAITARGMTPDPDDLTQLSQVIQAAIDSGTRKNLLIGNFRVNQRAVAGTVVLAAGEYGHDRFRGGSSGCTYTFAAVDGVTTLTITAGTLEQEVEGLSIVSGSHILSWQGTVQGRVDGGSYGASGAVTATLTGGVNAVVEFNSGTIALPQLELGSLATDFEYRPYGEELALCQRYYRVGEDHVVGGSNYTTTGSAHVYIPVTFPTKMRASPTVTRVNESLTRCIYSSITGVTVDGFYFDYAVTTVGNVLVRVGYTADAEI